MYIYNSNVRYVLKLWYSCLIYAIAVIEIIHAKRLIPNELVGNTGSHRVPNIPSFEFPGLIGAFQPFPH